MRKKDCRSLMTTMFTVAAMLVFTAPGIILGAEAVGFEDVESDMAASDKAFGLGDGGANSALEEADNAFAVDAPTQVSAEVGTPKKQKTMQDYMSEFQKTNFGSVPPSLVATMSYEQYQDFRRSKAEAYALTDASYGTTEFVPSRQIALEKVVQQAKDMQFSQEMVDEIASIFKLVDYVDYDYHVKYGKNPDNYLRLLREQQRRERLEREARVRRNIQLERLQARTEKNQPDFVTDDGINVNKPAPDDGWQSEGGVRVDSSGKPYVGPTTGQDRGYTPEELARMHKDLNTQLGSSGTSEIPEDVVSSIEASVHNAILEKLKARGYDVAALNVFLQNLSEIKVIAIITTSELPNSAIRSTLRNVRSMIENEVLAVKFKALRLAQLSSFTILNEVDNTFYEHPVLYWQMQLTGWDAKGRRISPGTPSVADVLPQADSNPEADALLSEFIGN